MGRLASQEQNDIWVQAPGVAVLGVGAGGGSPSPCGGISPGKFLRLYAKSCNLRILHFGVLNTLTTGTALPRVPPRNNSDQDYCKVHRSANNRKIAGIGLQKIFQLT